VLSARFSGGAATRDCLRYAQCWAAQRQPGRNRVERLPEQGRRRDPCFAAHGSGVDPGEREGTRPRNLALVEARATAWPEAPSGTRFFGSSFPGEGRSAATMARRFQAFSSKTAPGSKGPLATALGQVGAVGPGHGGPDQTGPVGQARLAGRGLGLRSGQLMPS